MLKRLNNWLSEMDEAYVESKNNETQTVENIFMRRLVLMVGFLFVYRTRN